MLLPAAAVPMLMSPLELKVRITEVVHPPVHRQFTHTVFCTVARRVSRDEVPSTKQSSYRCGLPRRKLQTAVCCALPCPNSHNRRYPAVVAISWKVPASTVSCGSSIRLSVILKGRPVSSELQPAPAPGAEVVIVRMTLSCRGVFPRATMSAHRLRDCEYQIPGIRPDCRHHPTVPAREPLIILNINGRMACSNSIHSLSSVTYRQPLSLAGPLQTDEAIAAAAFWRGPTAQCTSLLSCLR